MSAICPNNNGPLCTTCKLGGLIRCPIMGVPLPLVDGERPEVIKKKATKVWSLTEEQRMNVYRYLRDNGHFE
jgi:hypothetical protein